MITDYHIHSSLSPDGHALLSECCKAAIDFGLDELVVTDHYELYTADFKGYPFDDSYLETGYQMYCQCRAKYGEHLTLLYGLELGQSHLNPERTQEILTGRPFDYVIGSMHKLNNVDLQKLAYTTETVGLLLEHFLSQVLVMVTDGDFDCLGHFDLIARYASRADCPVPSYPVDLIDEILRQLIAKGRGLEINTSGLRGSLNRTMPGLPILQRYKALGGEILTFGSDAHMIDDIGGGIRDAMELAKAAGFRYATTYRNRKPSMYPI